MQYLLSQEEMDALKARAMRGDAAPDKEALQKLCTLAADHAPAYRNWDKDDTSPWGCILSAQNFGYCDDCPVKEICPHPHKRWSK